MTARFTPWSTKKVPRVTMKLGSLVHITSDPLRAPMASASTSEIRIDSQTFRSYCVIRMPVVRPVVPIIAPAERSNSPPIMSSDDRDRHDADRRGVEDPRAGAGRLEERVGAEREEEEDHEGAGHGADLGSSQDLGEPARRGDPFVGLRCGRIGRSGAVVVLMCVSFAGCPRVDRCCWVVRWSRWCGWCWVRSGCCWPGPGRSRGSRPPRPRPGQRVPPSANSRTSAAFSWVTTAGPELMGRPPPTSLPLISLR